jgi:hypothetical protein
MSGKSNPLNTFTKFFFFFLILSQYFNSHSYQQYHPYCCIAIFFLYYLFEYIASNVVNMYFCDQSNQMSLAPMDLIMWPPENVRQIRRDCQKAVKVGISFFVKISFHDPLTSRGPHRGAQQFFRPHKSF